MGLLDKLLGREARKEEIARIHGQESMAGTTMARDPVCGMEVNKEKAESMFLYLGQTLYFCSPSCKRLFRGNPGRYTKNEEHEMPRHDGHHM